MVKVEMGQQVVIFDHYSSRGAPTRGEVVKVARVWIEIQPEGQTSIHARRKFRLDTQTDGSEIGFRGRFYTLDQWAGEQRRSKAAEFLCEQGIVIINRSPWRGREVELAELLRAVVEPAQKARETATTKEAR